MINSSLNIDITPNQFFLSDKFLGDLKKIFNVLGEITNLKELKSLNKKELASLIKKILNAHRFRYFHYIQVKPLPQSLMTYTILYMKGIFVEPKHLYLAVCKILGYFPQEKEYKLFLERLSYYEKYILKKLPAVSTPQKIFVSLIIEVFPYDNENFLLLNTLLPLVEEGYKLVQQNNVLRETVNLAPKRYKILLLTLLIKRYSEAPEMLLLAQVLKVIWNLQENSHTRLYLRKIISIISQNKEKYEYMNLLFLGKQYIMQRMDILSIKEIFASLGLYQAPF